MHTAIATDGIPIGDVAFSVDASLDVLSNDHVDFPRGKDTTDNGRDGDHVEFLGLSIKVS